MLIVFMPLDLSPVGNSCLFVRTGKPVQAQAQPGETKLQASSSDDTSLPTWLKLKHHTARILTHFRMKSMGTDLVEVENERLKSLRQGHVYDDDFELLEYLNLVSRMEKGRDLLGDIFQREDRRPPSPSTPPYPRALRRRGPRGRGSGHLGGDEEGSESKRTIVAFSAPTSLDTSKGKNAMVSITLFYFD